MGRYVIAASRPNNLIANHFGFDVVCFFESEADCGSFTVKVQQNEN